MVSLNLRTCERFQDKKGCILEAQFLYLTDQFEQSYYKIKESPCDFIQQQPFCFNFTFPNFSGIALLCGRALEGCNYKTKNRESKKIFFLV